MSAVRSRQHPPDRKPGRCAPVYVRALERTRSAFQRAEVYCTEGAVVQLVRIPACHAGGRGFESRPLRQSTVFVVLLSAKAFLRCKPKKFGGIAQLGERLHGMQEVIGSIPFTSTKISCRVGRCSKVLTLSSRGLGHHPFTVATGVRIPVGSPN